MNYMEKNWNHYDYDDTANYIGGINESHLTIGHIRQAKSRLHFDIAAATQQQRNKKIEDTITHYIMYSNSKSYHHLLMTQEHLHMFV